MASSTPNRKTKYNPSDPLQIAATFSSLSDTTAGRTATAGVATTKSLLVKKGGFLAEAAKRTQGNPKSKPPNNNISSGAKSLQSTASHESQHTGHISKTEFYIKAKDRLASGEEPGRKVQVHYSTPPASYHEGAEEKKQDVTPTKDKGGFTGGRPLTTTTPVQYSQTAPLQQQQPPPQSAAWLDSMEPKTKQSTSSSLPVPALSRSDSDSTDVYLDEPTPLPPLSSKGAAATKTSKTPPTDDSSAGNSNSSLLQDFKAPALRQEASSQMQFYRDKLVAFFDDASANAGQGQDPTQSDQDPSETQQNNAHGKAGRIMDSSSQLLSNLAVALRPIDDEEDHNEEEPLLSPISPSQSEPPKSTSRGGKLMSSSVAVPSHSTLKMIVGDKPVPEEDAPAVRVAKSKFASSTVAVPSKSTLDKIALDVISGDTEDDDNDDDDDDDLPKLKKMATKQESFADEQDDSDSDDSYNPTATERPNKATSQPQAAPNHSSSSSVQKSFQRSSDSLSRSVSSREERYFKMEQQAAALKSKHQQKLNKISDEEDDSDSHDSYDPIAIEEGKIPTTTAQTMTVETKGKTREDRYSKMEKQAAALKSKQNPKVHFKRRNDDDDDDDDDDSYDPLAVEAGKNPGSPQNMTVETKQKNQNKDDSDSDLDSYDPGNPNFNIQENADGTIIITSKNLEVHEDEPTSRKNSRTTQPNSRERNATQRSCTCKLLLICLLLTGVACVGVGLYLYFGVASDEEEGEKAKTSAPTTAEPVFTFVPKEPTISPTFFPSDGIATDAPSLVPLTSAPTAVEVETETPTFQTESPTRDTTPLLTREPSSIIPATTATTKAPTTVAPTTAITDAPSTATTTLAPTTVKPSEAPTILESVMQSAVNKPSQPPTTRVPTQEEPAILQGLSDATWQRIQDNPSSPQAQSYQWLLDDPNAESLPSWQQEQRFALATMYYSWLNPVSSEPVLAAESSPVGSLGNSMNANDSNNNVLKTRPPLPPPLQNPNRNGGGELANNKNGEDGETEGTESGRYGSAFRPPKESSNDDNRRQRRKALRGRRRLQNGPLTNWLDYSSPECNWYYVVDSGDGDDTSDKGDGPFNVSITASSREGADDTPCNELGVYQRLTPPRTKGSLPGAMVDINMPTMPPEISMLTDLTEIQMPNNQYSTTLESFLPGNLAQLTNLRKLDLSQSSIYEWNPQSLLRIPTTLEVLDLSYNEMQGDLYMELGLLLTSLRELYLDGNALRGSIPIAIPSWTRLRHFQAASNDLSGNLPSEIGWLSSHLEVLSLSANRMDGLLPTEIGALSRLNSLDLDGNRFVGSIPSEVGALSSLVYFGLADNALVGSIPAQIAHLSLLNSIRLSNNRLTGTIPSEVGLLAALTNFQMHGNKFAGTIPSELGLLSSTLYSIDLHANALTGTIFTEIGVLRATNFLYLYENLLTGTLPTELGMLENASYIGLESNQLIGPIPTQFGNLQELRYLHLADNGLTSTIPTQLGRLGWLKYLFLGGNDLSGEIPSELGLLTGLRYLDFGVGNSNLRGSVPKEVCALPRLTIRVRCSRIECDCGCQCA